MMERRFLLFPYHRFLGDMINNEIDKNGDGERGEEYLLDCENVKFSVLPIFCGLYNDNELLLLWLLL